VWYGFAQWRECDFTFLDFEGRRPYQKDDNYKYLKEKGWVATRIDGVTHKVQYFNLQDTNDYDYIKKMLDEEDDRPFDQIIKHYCNDTLQKDMVKEPKCKYTGKCRTLLVVLYAQFV
jgi:hypothetical protein